MTKIIQLSDTHIVPEGQRAYDVVDTATALELAVQTINSLSETVGPIDQVVVSGDLTDSGSEEEYALFSRILNALQAPYAVLPGNHDLRAPMRENFAHLPTMPKSGGINWEIPFNDLLLVGLDTLVEGEPFGELSDVTLSWLEEVVASADRPLLLALHHPPFDVGIRHMDVQKLKQPEALLERLADARVPVTVCCGHVHRFVATQSGNTSILIAPSPAHAVTLDLRPDGPSTFTMEPGGLLLHETNGQQIVSQFVPVGNFGAPHPFFASKTG